MEVVIVHTRPWNHDKSPKPYNFVVMLYTLEDVSINLLGYSHYRCFSEEKWDKEWRKTEVSVVGSNAMRPRSRVSRNFRGKLNVQPLDHAWCTFLEN